MSIKVSISTHMRLFVAQSLSRSVYPDGGFGSDVYEKEEIYICNRDMCFPSITAKQDTNKNENTRKHGLFILSGFQQPKLCHKTKYFLRLGNLECGRRTVGFWATEHHKI